MIDLKLHRARLDKSVAYGDRGIFLYLKEYREMVELLELVDVYMKGHNTWSDYVTLKRIREKLP